MITISQPPNCRSRVRRYILISTALLYPLASVGGASTCRCIDINDSWETFRATIATASGVDGLGGGRPHVLFCPFHVLKLHDQKTDHESELLALTSPIHIQCNKRDKTDRCVIESAGPTCKKKMRCGQVIHIDSDDVWLTGFTMRGAQVGSVTVQQARTGIKLVDMEFDG